LGKNSTPEIEQQDGVELGDLFGCPVILLHEYFGGAPGFGGIEAKAPGELFLVVEQQAVFAASGEMVQADAHMLQEALQLAQFGGFFVGDQAVPGQVAPVGANARRAADPADDLQVPKPPGAFLAVRLQRIGGFVVAGVALLLLEPLGLEELSGIENAPKADVKPVVELYIAEDTAGFQQVGHHRYVERGFLEAGLDGAYAVPDVEANVPDQANHLGQAFLQVGVGLVLQQEQQIHVRTGKELFAPIAADSHQRGGGGKPEILPKIDEHLIHQMGAAPQDGVGQRSCLIGSAQGFTAALEAGLATGDQFAGGVRWNDGRGIGHLRGRRSQGRRLATMSGRGGAAVDRVSTSTPVSVTRIMCSHWADRLRSRVTMVQPSGSSEMAALPALIIGSMVKIMPGLSSMPVPGLP
jgi:hypothetical protein